MAENESGGTGGGGYSSCGAGLPDSADVGRVPELPVSSAAMIMAQLTALSKQMEAIQQQQTEMKAILQQQTSGNLARSGVSNISVGICKPHTPAEKGAASDKALSMEYLAKYCCICRGRIPRHHVSVRRLHRHATAGHWYVDTGCYHR